MRQGVDPHFDVTYAPVFWSAVTMIGLGLSVNFVLHRPGWLLPAAIIAGGVAAATSDFYEPSGNNALLGVLLGMIIITPVIAWARISLLYGIDDGWDLVFLSTGLAGGWLTLVFVIVLPMAYIAAWVVDRWRRRIGGPFGYDTP